MGANTLTATAALLALFTFAIALFLFCLYLLNRRAFYGLRVLLDRQVYKNIWVFITTGAKPLTLNLSEDDYYSPQVVLLPQKNARHCREEFNNLAKIEKTKIVHQEGFTSYGSIYMLKETPYHLSGLDIKLTELEGVFSTLPKFNSLSLNYKKFIKNVYGYGFPSFTIFTTYTEEKITGLWIRKSHLENEAQFNHLSTILNNIGKKWGLVLIDWQKRKIINLKDANEVKAYLRREIREEATRGGEYLIRIKGAKFPKMDPNVETEYVDRNPFGFKRTGVRWTWVHKDGRAFSLSPEPPGLQVSFDHTNEKDEKAILKYIQTGIPETTEIIWV